MLTALAVGALVIGLVALVAGLLALRMLGRLRRSVGVLQRASDARLEMPARVTSDLDAAYGSLPAELAAVRADAERRAADTAAGVEARLDALKDVVDRELAGIRHRLSADTTAAVAAMADDRSGLREVAESQRAELRGLADQVQQALGVALRRVALVRFDAFEDLSGRLSFALALLDGHGDGIVVSTLAGRTESRVYAKPIAGGAGVNDLSPEEHEAVTAALRQR